MELPKVITEDTMAPYRYLAGAVLERALLDAKGDNVKRHKTKDQVDRERKQAKRFLFHNNDMFPFWCHVVGVNPEYIRNGIIDNFKTINIIGRRKELRKERKKERKKRRHMTAETKKLFLADMKDLMPLSHLTKKYDVGDSTCFYHSKLNKIPMQTTNGVYRP